MNRALSAILSEVPGFSVGVITVVIALASMVCAIAAGGVAFSLLLLATVVCHLCRSRINRCPTTRREGLDESGLGTLGIQLLLEH
jgi:ABC-type phosphate transport system permease subunit